MGVSISINLGIQYISLLIYSGKFAIYFAMFFGTISAFIVKFILDKFFVFQFKSESLKQDLSKFILYTALSVITTLIFWITEILFNKLFNYEWAKYVGALLGLILGYTMKYWLDKNFVFISRKTDVLKILIM